MSEADYDAMQALVGKGECQVCRYSPAKQQGANTCHVEGTLVDQNVSTWKVRKPST
jgi:hypothetical protein